MHLLASIILAWPGTSWPLERGDLCPGAVAQRIIEPVPDTMLVFDVEHYKITLDLDIPAETLSALTEIQLRLLDASDSIRLDFVGMNVSGIKEGTTPRSFMRMDSSLVIALGRTAAAGTDIELSISYHGKPTLASQGFGKGLYINSSAADDAVTYTCSAPWGAKYWFPCQDDPQDKATMEMAVTVPSDFQVISNGVLSSVGTSGSLKTYHWQEMHPVATYLTAFAASRNYAVTVDTALIAATHLPLYHWVLEKDSAEVTPGLMGVREIIEYFSDIFYPYPFLDEKYAQVYAPVSGAMENQTCTHINTGIAWGDWGVITAHELSHSWWGNSTGFRRLKHVWLSEGLATYSAALWVEHRDGQAAYQKYFETDIAGRYLSKPAVFSYTILDPPWSYVYSELTYEKPAAVLHMLRRLVGDEDFFTILKTYGERFKDSTALSVDFEAVVDEVTGSDYSWFFDEWLRSPAHPQYMITWSCESAGDSSVLNIRVRQTQSWPANVGLFKMPLEFGLVDGADTTFVSFTDSLEDQTCSFSCAHPPSSVLFDPHGNLLKKTQPGVQEVASGPSLGFECSPVTSTRLAYSCRDSESIDISLFDASGRRLAFWSDMPASGELNLSDYAGGVYFLKVQSSVQSIKRVVLVK